MSMNKRSKFTTVTEVITSLPVNRRDGRGIGTEVGMMSLLLDITGTAARFNRGLRDRAPAGCKACLNTLHVFYIRQACWVTLQDAINLPLCVPERKKERMKERAEP